MNKVRSTSSWIGLWYALILFCSSSFALAATIPPLPQLSPLSMPVLAQLRSLQSPLLSQRQLAIINLRQFGAKAARGTPLLLVQLRLPSIVKQGQYKYLPTSSYKKEVLKTIATFGKYGYQAVPYLVMLVDDATLGPLASRALQAVSPHPFHTRKLVYQILLKVPGEKATLWAIGQTMAIPSMQNQWLTAFQKILDAPSVLRSGQRYIATHSMKTAILNVLGAARKRDNAILSTLLARLSDASHGSIAHKSLGLYLQRHPLNLREIQYFLTHSKNVQTRFLLLQQLRRFGSKASSTLPVLLGWLKANPSGNLEYKLNKETMLTLGAMQAAARPAIGKLRSLLQGKATQKEAAQALRSILQPTAVFVPVLKSWLAPSTSAMEQSIALSVVRRGSTAWKSAFQSRLLTLILPAPNRPLSLREDAVRQLTPACARLTSCLSTLLFALKSRKKGTSKASLRQAIVSQLGILFSARKEVLTALLESQSDATSVRLAARKSLQTLVKKPLDWMEVWHGVLMQNRSPQVLLTTMVFYLRCGYESSPREWALNPMALALSQNILKKSGHPRWMWAFAEAKLAETYASRRSNHALTALKSAIAKGYDDFLSLYFLKVWKPYHTNKIFQKLIRSIRMTARDQAELWWLLKEKQAVHHDTTMIQVENMGRKDSGWTLVPQSTIPVTPTDSVGVLTRRWELRSVQKQQKLTVLLSDMQRRSHLLSMSIIRNMGKQSLYQRQANLRMQQISRLFARQRARRRRNRVLQRKFRAPATQSKATLPVPGWQTLQSQGVSYRRQKIVSLVYRGDFYRRKKLWSQAKRSYKTVLSLQPTHAGALRGLAQVAIHHRRWKAAFTYLKRLATSTQATASDWNLFGLAAFQTRQYASALQGFQEAHKRNPQHAEYLSNTGASLVRLGQWNKALPYLQKAMQKAPRNALYRANLGYVYLRLGQRLKAIQLGRPLLKVQYANGFVYYFLALLVLQQTPQTPTLNAMAWRYLLQGIRAGFADVDWMKKEPLLQQLQPKKKRLQLWKALKK